MKILPGFIKTFKENIRDWKILILVVVFAPFFVYLMKAYIGHSGTNIYHVAVLNRDQNGSLSKELISKWADVKTEDGESVVHVLPVEEDVYAKKMIQDKNADLFLTIPAGFSLSFQKYLDTRKGLLPALISYGDQTRISTMMAASIIDYTTYNYFFSKSGIELPVAIQYESANVQKKISDFDLYVPALLILSVIMMLFTAGASVIREVEKGTITRISLSRLSSFDFMTALSMNQIIIGITCLSLTLLAAFSVGYRTEGSLFLLLCTGVITCFTVIGFGIITACFVKNMFGLLTVGCFPFFILMFFSDCFMPLPKINLIRLSGNQFYVNDLLCTATATRTLNKVLSYNASLSEIRYELMWMVVLSIIYFMIGIWLFKKKYYPK